MSIKIIPIMKNMNNIYYLINVQWSDNPVLVATIKLNVYKTAVLRKC